MNKTARITLRPGRSADTRRLHALIAAHQAEGRLLPRAIDEIRGHVGRFIVARQGGRIVGCAELAPLSSHVAEVRSLAVDRSARGHRVGAALVAEIRQRARRDGFETLCAFTHAPSYFSRMGFSIVPHLWVGEKVFTDCIKCPQFRQCGQYAMMLPLHGVQPADEVPEGLPASLPVPLGGSPDAAIALRLA